MLVLTKRKNHCISIENVGVKIYYDNQAKRFYIDAPKDVVIVNKPFEHDDPSYSGFYKSDVEESYGKR